jgi:hypothetical protein
MSIMTSLLDFIRHLLFDEGERVKFEEDPHGYLRDHHLEHISAEDVRDAFSLVYDSLPAHVASQFGSFARSTSTGSGWTATHQHAETSAPHLPVVEPRHGETHLDAAIRQVSYITNTYSTTHIDDRDTVLDNSVNQQVFAHGDVHQMFDNDPVIASGDHAVAAGHGIHGQVVTGDHNVVGDGNVSADHGGVAAGHGISDSQVITGENSGLAAHQAHVDDAVLGDHNQVAQDSHGVGFGHGDVTHAELHDVTADHGSAIPVGGDAHGHYEDRDVQLANFGHGDVHANVNTGDHGEAHQTVDHSTDHSVHESFTADHSFNDHGIHDSDIGNTDHSVHDSGIHESLNDHGIHDSDIGTDHSIHDHSVHDSGVHDSDIDHGAVH